MEINLSIEKNIEYIKKANNNNKDLVIREIFCATTKIAVCYINGQTDEERLEKNVLGPLQNCNEKTINANILKQKVISLAKLEDVLTMEDASSAIMKGDAIIFIDKNDIAIKCAVFKPEKRTVAEPPTSAVIYGPREGFIENIKANISLLRKRLPTTSLVLDEMDIGRYTKTKVVLAYLNDIADMQVVENIKKRLKKVDIDGVIDSQYLISFLEERKGSILKQVGKTEKPDIAVAKMLEGRIVILVDGTPIVLTLPFIFFEDLQNSDDYYQRSFRVSIKRFLRVVGLLFSILLPGGYVAIQLYHYRIVPLKFLVTIINSTQGIPFTPFLEMLFVIVLFEILFEASLRMPKYLGIAISIVGALVLGDIAVKAGLISSPAVMIIALTGISFYVVPEQASQLSVIRLLFTLLGGAFGIIGISLGSVFLLTYLVEFNAYGSPYLAPYSPYIKNDLKDGVFKKQTVALNTRPESIPNQKIIRKK